METIGKVLDSQASLLCGILQRLALRILSLRLGLSEQHD